MRATDRSSLAAEILPSATARRKPAIAASVSGDFTTWSPPARIARTAASPGSKWSTIPPMSTASVTTSPAKPSSPRRRPSTIAGDMDAGTVASRATSEGSSVSGFSPGARTRNGAGVASSAGMDRCAVMTAPTPAAIAARNGTISTCSSRARSAPSTGSARWESVRVSPCPGKCLTVASTPPAWTPRTNAATNRPTVSGSSP